MGRPYGNVWTTNTNQSESHQRRRYGANPRYEGAQTALGRRRDDWSWRGTCREPSARCTVGSRTRNPLESRTPRSTAIGERLFRPDELLTDVHFPLTGVVSIVSGMDDGSSIEVATAGNEGMVGLPVYFGVNRTRLEGFSQVPGDVISVPAPSFRGMLERSGDLREVMGRYSYARMIHMGQTAACNAVHSVEQRASRWLLSAQDRVQTDEFQLTQEALAQMLGVRTASISETASGLQRMGLIRYQRGRLTIHDRLGLEGLVCECYWIVRDEYSRQLAPRAE